MERVSKRQYYLDIAAEVARRSTCLRRQYGAVIVKNDEIVATGYNGAPRGDGSAWPSTPSATPSSPPAATRCWAPPSISMASRTVPP